MNISDCFSQYATLVFVGDSETGRSLFESISSLLLEYKHTVKGTPRKSYKVILYSNDQRTIYISSIKYDLIYHHGVVILHYEYYVSLGLGDSFNRDKFAADILNRLEIRASKLNYCENTQYTQGVPMLRTFIKPCKGVPYYEVV